MLLQGDEGGCKIWRGWSYEERGQCPYHSAIHPLSDPCTGSSPNKNSSGKISGFAAAAVMPFFGQQRWLRPPFPVTVRLTQGIMKLSLAPPKRGIYLGTILRGQTFLDPRHLERG